MFKTTRVYPQNSISFKYRMINNHTQMLFEKPLGILGINILNQDSKHIF